MCAKQYDYKVARVISTPGIAILVLERDKGIDLLDAEVGGKQNGQTYYRHNTAYLAQNIQHANVDITRNILSVWEGQLEICFRNNFYSTEVIRMAE